MKQTIEMEPLGKLSSEGQKVLVTTTAVRILTPDGWPVFFAASNYAAELVRRWNLVEEMESAK